jgi:hypothetical protein
MAERAEPFEHWSTPSEIKSPTLTSPRSALVRDRDPRATRLPRRAVIRLLSRLIPARSSQVSSIRFAVGLELNDSRSFLSFS